VAVHAGLQAAETVSQRLFESVQILRLRPDDVVVVEVDDLHPDQMEQVKEKAQEQFPDNKVIVASKARIRIVRSEAA
jgi:hypothetical protein